MVMSGTPVSSTATPVIRCRHLRVGYGSFVLMKDISFDVMPGDIFFITGGSGCGKSTLLRVLMGLKAPQAGTVSFGDTPFWPGSDGDRLKVRRRTGVLFQQGALWSSMTLAENIALPLRQYTSLSDRDIRRQALLKLSLAGLTGFEDYYPSEISGGMRKRAGLARAIIAEPKLLLCDEPTSGLDPITAARMDDLLLSMHRHYPDMTIVVVSHDLASLKRIADQVLVLRDGVSLYCGDLNGLEKSQDPYLVQFLHREPGPEEEEAGELMQPSVAARLEAWRRR